MYVIKNTIPSQAARIALSTVITTTRARQLAAAATQQLPSLCIALQQLKEALDDPAEGVSHLQRNGPSVFALLRSCHVTLRWCMLHGGASCNRKLREALKSQGPSDAALVALLVDMARVEVDVRRLYGQLLSERGQRWGEHRQQAQQHLGCV